MPRTRSVTFRAKTPKDHFKDFRQRQRRREMRAILALQEERRALEREMYR